MRLLLSVMCLMMIINAYVVLDIGFWLSCGMVAILIVVCGYSVSPQSGIIHMLKVQWRISCVGFPLTLLLLQQGSLMSPLANIIAIPVVSFGVVPLLLLMDCTVNFQPELAQLCLTLSNFITEYLMLFLSRLSELPLYMEQPLQHPWMAVALGLSGILFALPRGLNAGILGFYFLMIVIVYPPEKPEDNEVWVTWLDVGQGLSTVIQTKNHVVVYDTGPQFESFDVATFTLIPFLKYHGVREIDMLIVSHADNDHRGGVNVVLETFQVHDMRVGQRLPDISMPQSLCHEDKRWEWDGVLFEQLNVPGEWKSSNNHSCVLKITASGHTVLLLGDLERDAEAALLRSHPGLSAQIISVPHHGSKTSSTLQRLEAVKPEYAIFSSGFLNRYHHPHPTVLKRYDALGIKRLDTGKVGAIRVTLDDKDDAGIICHRDKKCLSTFYRAGS
jgi:competence protein ComEC